MKNKIDNKGYSLIELVIVIGIIAVFSVASLSTIVYMRNAKAKEAAVTFDTEVATLANKSRSQACVYDNGDGNKEARYNSKYILKVYKDGDSYYAKNGYMDSTGTEFYFNDENSSEGKGRALTSYIDLKYNDGTNTVDVDDSGVVIVYDKTGRCISGDGTFEFYRKNAGRICNVFVNKNGSHRVY